MSKPKMPQKKMFSFVISLFFLLLGITPAFALPNDATLSSLRLDGFAISNFYPQKLGYNIQLPLGTVSIPTITVTTTDVNASAVISNTTSLPGTTTIEVTSADSSVTKTYYVDFTEGDVYEWNNNRDSATQLTLNTTQTGHTLDSPKDIDWFKFDAEAGNNYTISTSDLTGTLDTYLLLYDSQDHGLKYNDNFDARKESQIRMYATYDGPYYVGVDNIFGFGGYNIGVSLDTSGVPFTPPTLNNTYSIINQEVNLSTSDAQWLSGITGISVDGTAVSSSFYTNTGGKITLSGQLFTTPKVYNILISSNGYSDKIVSHAVGQSVNRISGAQNCTISVYGNVYDGGNYSSTTSALTIINPDYYPYFPNQKLKFIIEPKAITISSVSVVEQFYPGTIMESNGVYTYYSEIPGYFTSSSDWPIFFLVAYQDGSQETLRFEPKTNIQLPAYLGGSTTDLTKVTDFTNVSNLTFEQPSYGKITFTQPINLTSLGKLRQLALLDSSLYFNQNEIGINGKYAPNFDLPAQVTLYNLNLASGTTQEDTKQLLTSFEFNTLGSPVIPNGLGGLDPATVVFTDGGSGAVDTLSFNVSGFSSYALKPGLTVNYPELNNGNFSVSGKVYDLSSTVTINVYDNADHLVSGPIPVTLGSTGAFSHNFSLSNGQYRVLVSADNNSVTEVTEDQVVCDTLAPTFVISTIPSPAKAGNVTVTVRSNEELQATPTVTVNGTPFSVNPTVNANEWSGTYVVTTENGNLPITVSGTDLIGHVGNGSSNLSTDTIAPLAPYISLPLTDSTGYSSSITVSGYAYEPNIGINIYKTGGVLIGSGTSASTVTNNVYNYNFTANFGESGSFTLTAKALDAAGNYSLASNTVSYTVYSSGSPGNLSELPSAIQPAITTVKEDLSSSLTNTVADIDGQKVTTVTVNETTALEAINKNATLNSVVIPLPQDTPISIAQLSSKLFTTLAEKNATVEVIAKSGCYLLPANEIKIAELANKFGVPSSELKVTIKIAELKPDQVATISQEMAAKGLTQASIPIEFKIEVAAGTQKTEINSFGSYVSREINLTKPVESATAVGVVREPDGTISPVPTQFKLIDGKSVAVIKRKTNSTYMVIENNKVFVDVTKHWAKKEINTLASKLIISGIDANTFAPENKITRAQFATLIVRSLGLETKANKTSFNDVKAGDWFSGAVSAAVDAGIIKGYTNGDFRPNALVTREELTTMVVRSMQASGLESALGEAETGQYLAKLSDQSKISPWAKTALAVAVKNGIVKGNSTGNFEPDNNCTRAESAVMLMRLLTKANFI